MQKNLFRASLLVLVLGLMAFPAMGQQFQIPITFTNDATPGGAPGKLARDTVRLGVNPNNTFNQDNPPADGGYAEPPAPPLPPDYQLAVQFPTGAGIPNIPNLATKDDYRQYRSPTQVDSFLVVISGKAGSGSLDGRKYPVTISWPSGLGSFGTSWTLSVINPGGVLSGTVNMITSTSATLTAQGFFPTDVYVLIVKVGSPAVAVTVTNSVPVGGVTHTAASMWVRTSGPSRVNIQLSTSPAFTTSLFGVPETTFAAKNYAAIINVGGLQPDTRYFYRVTLDSIPQSRVASFSTFPTPGTSSTFTFAFGSCQQSGTLLPSATPPGNIFREIARHNPRFFLQIGDYGYPDSTETLPFDSTFFAADFAKVQASYLSKFDPSYLMDTLLSLTPIDYVYDDHDFMNDNASANTSSFSIPIKPNPLSADFVVREIANPPGARANSIRGYKENFPGYPIVNESRGIYHKFTYGNAELFAIDLRSQRSPNLNSILKNTTTGKWEFVPPAGHSIIGRNNAPGSGQSQMDWFLNALQASTARWKFVMSSVPFNKAQAGAIQLGIQLQDSILNLPGLPTGTRGVFAALEFADKWVGFPEDIATVLQFIQTNNIKNVIVLSGDSHTAAIDDGTNAGLPELMAAGLDITNSRIVALFASFGLNIWNRGGQGLTTAEFNNAFGKVTVFGQDSVRLALVDEFGTQFAAYTVQNKITGVQEHSLPTSFSLEQNYPNPFNPTTTIRFSIPAPTKVSLKLFNTLGQEVATLIDDQRPAGAYTYELRAGSLPSGVYFYRLQAGAFTDVKTLMLLK